MAPGFSVEGAGAPTMLYVNKKFGSPTNQVSPRRRESISRFFAEKMSESIFVQGIGGQM